MNSDESSPSLLLPGSNCWLTEQAEAIAFLVDGEAYYRAVREAIAQARHSILMLGWDIDSRLKLIDEPPRDGHPVDLGDFLNSVVRQRKGLHAHILMWDFAMIYTLEREWLPIYKLGWRTHRRLRFRLDDQHPLGASHHQKVVVVDDKVAFVGGFDLSKWRWDSSEHRADDPRRVDPDGNPYPPFHDIQMLVSGPAAARLGDLARERWYRATGERLSAIESGPEHMPWPASAEPALRDVEIGIARTLPRYGQYEEVREIEQLHLDIIDSARRFLYFENQYLTSGLLQQAISRRLEEEHGPEVAIVLPRKTGGWLEQHTMDVLRDRLLHHLQESDRYNRLRIYYVTLPGTQPEFVQVHSKVVIADDDHLTIGSANLSNRSMGLDSECNLALDSHGEVRQQRAIAAFRSQLLAEHLGCDPQQAARTLEREGSLLATIEQLRGNPRTLTPLEPTTPPEVDGLVPDQQLLDPERPIEPDKMVNLFVGEEEQKPAGRRMLGAGLMLGALLLLAALWRWTPLGAWLTPERLQGLFESIATLPAAPLIIIATFIVAGLAVVPLTLLVVVTVLTFGPLEGILYSHVGATLSALVAFGIGQRMGRQTIRQLTGSWINRLSRRLGERGILAIIVLRIIPVAPFTVINLVAGASHIRFRDFLIGTLIGLLPGMLALGTFVDGLLRTLQNPSWRTLVWLLVVIAIIALGSYLLQRGLAYHRRRKKA
ncbi:MAG: VTT domain-containing protein [Pseudomonadota bacterium]